MRRIDKASVFFIYIYVPSPAPFPCAPTVGLCVFQHLYWVTLGSEGRQLLWWPVGWAGLGLARPRATRDSPTKVPGFLDV